MCSTPEHVGGDIKKPRKQCLRGERISHQKRVIQPYIGNCDSFESYQYTDYGTGIPFCMYYVAACMPFYERYLLVFSKTGAKVLHFSDMCKYLGYKLHYFVPNLTFLLVKHIS